MTCAVTCNAGDDMSDSIDPTATYTGMFDSLIHLVSLEQDVS